MRILDILRRYKVLILVSTVLFIIPFFWLKPGQMDLGGDGNRLYFYDPITYLKSTALYDISAYGKGVIEPLYIYIPYILFIALLRFFASPTIAIDIVNGLKLSVGFLGIYLIIQEFLTDTKKDKNSFLVSWAATLAGLMYTVALGTGFINYFWDRALVTHNQIFLNPLIFYLLFKYLKYGNFWYLWITLLVSFIFAPNFGPVGAPPFFAFYPLAICFLVLYLKLFHHVSIWKRAILAGLSFLGVHAFHLLAEGISLLDKGSNINSIVFSKHGIENEGVAFFQAISNMGKVSQDLLLPTGKPLLIGLTLIIPFIVLAGFILSKSVRKHILLTTVFFLITLYLSSANVTHLGYRFYVFLFYIPGFSMFRHFFEQWYYVYIFFYAILVGLTSYEILVRLKPTYQRIFLVLVLTVLLISGFSLFLGEPVNKISVVGSSDVPSLLKFDPRYEETLIFIRSLPNDGKFLVLPLTDNFRQLLTGIDGGAYEGPSTLLLLTNKYSFSGYQPFGYLPDDPAPYAEAMMKYTREKNYGALTQIFSTLNIRYILYDSDPRIYDKHYFPDGDYSYMRTSMPVSQTEYAEYLSHLPLHKIYSNGPYIIYEFNQSYYNPTIFIPNGIYESPQLSSNLNKLHSIFFSQEVCQKSVYQPICQFGYRGSDVTLTSTMINPTKYQINISNYNGSDPILLVLQHVFHNGWKLILNGRIIADNTHIAVNGYANGWLLSRKELPSSTNFNLTIELEPQKYFWYGWLITCVSLGLLICYSVIALLKYHVKTK